MTVKTVERHARVCKGLASKIPRQPPTSVVGLITENVLVPITKTVFVEKSSRVPSERRTARTIRSRKHEGDATIPLLLTQPLRIPSKRFRCNEQKPRTSNDHRNSTVPLFDDTTTTVSRRLRKDKKTKVLPFPSPISANASPAPEHVPPPKRRKTNKSRVELDRCRADSRVNAIQPQTTPRFFANDPITVVATNSSNSLIDVGNHDTEIATRRALSDLQSIDWLSTDKLTAIFDRAVRLLEIDSLGIPVAFTVATTPARIAGVTTVTVSEAEAEAEPETDTKTDTETETETDTETTTEAETETKAEMAVETVTATTEAKAETTTAATTTSTDVCQSLFQLFGRCDESGVVSRQKCGDDTDCPILPRATATLSEDEHPCKRKYSWQVLGKNTQTSRTLLEHLLQETFDDATTYACAIKYSWQIIGIGTQTSKEDLADSRLPVRWYTARNVDGTSRKASTGSSNVTTTRNNESPAVAKLPRRNSNKAFPTTTQGTQTCAHKEIQTNFIEFYAKQ